MNYTIQLYPISLVFDEQWSPIYKRKWTINCSLVPIDNVLERRTKYLGLSWNNSIEYEITWDWVDQMHSNKRKSLNSYQKSWKQIDHNHPKIHGFCIEYFSYSERRIFMIHFSFHVKSNMIVLSVFLMFDRQRQTVRWRN